MRTLLVVLVVLDVGSACASKDPPAATAGSGEGEAAPFIETARDALIGHRAPAVTLEMLDGSHVDLAKDLGHRPIYLKFWATWCVPCREQMPHLDATFRAHGNELAIYAIDVGVDDPIENVRSFVAQQQLEMPIAVDRDGSVAEQFHLNVTPQHILIDRGERVVPQVPRR